MTRDQVIAQFGAPSVDAKQPGGGEALIYSTAPMGELAYAASLDASGHVTQVFQVLTLENFARIVPHVWTEETVRDNFGIAANKREIRGNLVWDYRYKEQDVYYSLFSVTFAADGTVLKTENGPDPMFDGGRDGGGRK